MQIFSHFFNVHISVIRMKSPCVIVHKQVKMLSHVVNITVHSVRITWCKLWQQFGWPLLNWNAEGCISYVCHMSISKVQMYTLLYCGILIEGDGFEMFELFRIWLISQYLSAHISHCKVIIDNMVHNSGPYFIRYVPLFLVSSASSSVHHESLLLFFLWSVDPDRFLDVHPLSEFVTLVFSSLSIYAFQLKVHDMHLWALSEHWYIIGWSTLSSLMKTKIHLHNSW